MGSGTQRAVSQYKVQSNRNIARTDSSRELSDGHAIQI
jgi:hypothetical protein